ncbi:high affinity nitrate transporter 2.7-like isoform X1 [Vicia villosa]|uniref:high affinity nitrate transporter 2.7-like isoform X1 n=1 Tax=Vicia villosa TaxID=3911 RepID=UPI00273B0D9C|nr:high affinity nitrate transporter 2.7-like isoform X1 [Vicia villosa]
MEKQHPMSHEKATEFRPFSVVTPHMRTFHLSWFNLFSCFFTTFSIPPLLPVIRHDLNLTAGDIGRAGSASFAGSILSRLLMGPICDLVGPRRASGILSLITAPIILLTSIASTPGEFILVRFLVGFSLANFVANQFWMSSMFDESVVGSANAFSAGWANTGSGVTQLVMPLIYSSLVTYLPSSTAWRVSFIVPAVFQTVTGVLVLAFGHEANKIPSEPKENTLKVIFGGLRDYRGWILGLLYGFSFGVEMTTDNIIAQYFYDRFGVNLETAGIIAACFGITNLFSRPMGGMVSDKMGKRFGMRGRLWGLWIVQTVAGLLCVMLGRLDSLWSSIVIMCCFSVFVQAASGLTFGVVPFVSKSSLGVISGMTGSGGTIGAVVTQMLLFSGDNLSKQTSISLMGLMMILCTLPVTLIYFPQWGGIFYAPSPHYDYGYDQENYTLLE